MISICKPIVVIIDSGIGGVSILRQLIEKHGCGNFLYYADNLYMPYGNKTVKWLKNRIENIILELKTKYNISQIVLACNTASTCFNETCNNVVTMKFNKNNTYLATQLTQKNKPDINIIADKTLAKLIEKHIFDEKRLTKIINRHLKISTLTNHKEIVLGCTHYELIKPIFENICPNIKFINNSSFMLDEIKAPIVEDLNVIVLTSKKDEELENKIFKLIEMG